MKSRKSVVGRVFVGQKGKKEADAGERQMLISRGTD